MILASPTIGTSTSTFLPISAGSTSIWIILASLANSEIKPVVRSENLHPIAMIQSHSSTTKFVKIN